MCTAGSTKQKTITVDIQSNGIIRQQDGLLIGRLTDNVKFEEIQPEAITKVITDAIRNDSDLYLAYQANIAMAFKDEFDRSPKKYKNRQDIHEIANKAAKNFLNLWIKTL